MERRWAVYVRVWISRVMTSYALFLLMDQEGDARYDNCDDSTVT